MRRVPIRLRLTAAFALAMLLVLAAAAVFVYAQVRTELNESVEASLRARADAVEARAGRSGEALVGDGTLLEAEEYLAQVISPSGRLLASAGGARASAVDNDRLERAGSGPLFFDARLEGIEGTARVLARPLPGRPGVLAVGQSLDDRDETLAGLIAAFAVGGAVAVVLASLLGYLLATAGLAPVEAMRRRATEISLAGDDSLPLPAANDEVRRLGETLNEMLGRLRGSFERERRFVADASHELRTPVTVLKAEIEAALQAGGHEPNVRDSLVAALEECDHLAQLAEDLLVVARTGDGALPLRVEDLDAKRLLEETRDRFRFRAEQQGRTISMTADADLTLAADPLRIRQALGNLVDNALRHGGGDIDLGAAQADGSVDLTVTDDGDGFPAELAHTAFDRFTRGDTARTRGGAGLGLAIVRTIAEAHRGTAELVAGPRTTVRIRLPA